MEALHHDHKEGFTLAYGLAQLTGTAAVVMVVVWAGYYKGGFSWRSNPSVEFNWHPVLMLIGMVFLLGNGVMVYRAYPNFRKYHLKVTHAVMQIIAFILSVIGLQAVFDSHNLATPPIPNMYSLHSWIGLTAVILFACQFITGFITFLFPGLKISLRSAYLPIHVYFGNMAFVCSVAASLLGMTEKAFFMQTPKYSDLTSETLLINFIGVAVVVFACLVMFILTESKYKRQPRPEDEILLGGGYE
ncbi:transmembrane ascorbate-dependent reductase CYB561 [Schistocerca nitens]|uniref:transmembrane ascorbate-dependent reductase CYB561 n=1 Tax=Schistocerca nitens TaxID=7011 RepID=UPI002118A632|nr:transmembrane ascorbate-dependent reductase CYB561 [Schistocerca nitens]